MIKYTQEDILNTLQNIINDYKYYTRRSFNISSNTTYIVIEKDDTIASCVGIESNIIKHLRTKKEFRNLGMATFLIHKAEEIIKVREYMFASAFVNKNNKIAINLFSKNNYFPVSFNDYCYYLKKRL